MTGGNILHLKDSASGKRLHFLKHTYEKKTTQGVAAPATEAVSML